MLSGGAPGTHHVEGGGVGYWPPQLRRDGLRRGASPSPRPTGSPWPGGRPATEGIFSGPSTGVNLVAALRLAARLGPGHRVVTVQVDSGLKYLSGTLYA